MDRQTDCQVPCVCPESRAAPAEWETTAQAPAVSKGPGSHPKSQEQPLTCPSYAGIAAQPCLLTECTPLPLQTAAETCWKLRFDLWWAQEDKDPEGFPDK